MIVVLLAPGCALRQKSISERVRLGELAFRIQRSDGIIYVVQTPSVPSLRGVLSELNCGTDQSCSVEIVRMSLIGTASHGLAARATISLSKDTKADETVLPAGTYEIYLDKHSTQTRLMFVRLSKSFENPIPVQCELVESSVRNRKTLVSVQDMDSEAVLQKIQIRGESTVYVFNSP